MISTEEFEINFNSQFCSVMQCLLLSGAVYV